MRLGRGHRQVWDGNCDVCIGGTDVRWRRPSLGCARVGRVGLIRKERRGYVV